MASQHHHFGRREFHRHTLLIAIALCSFLAACGAPAIALDPERPLSQSLLRIWQSQQGLPRAAIYSIRQSSNGYLWLGTQSGLYRFDGVRFVPGLIETKEQHQAPVRPWIQDLVEDHNHDLWIATDGDGLIQLKSGAAISQRRVSGLPSDNVRCLLIDRQGALWIGMEKGLARLQDGKLDNFSDDGWPGKQIRALSEAPDGTIWIAFDERKLCSWNGVSFQHLDPQNMPPRGVINAIVAGVDGSIWIGTTEGLFRSVNTTDQPFKEVAGLETETTYDLAPAKNGDLWAGTKDGLYRIQGERIDRFQTKDGLSQSTVYSLCEDHEGSLWVGTKHGLNQLAERRTLLPFTTSEGLPSNDTGPILQDSDGNIWVGTLNAGLAKFDGHQFASVALTQSSLPSKTILSLADGGAEGLWIGTDNGLCRFRDGHVVDRFTQAEGLPSDSILCLGRDRSGALWAGTTAGLSQFRDGRFHQPEGANSAISRPVHSLVDYGGEYLIAATVNDGLFRVVDGKLEPLSKNLSELKNIETVYVDEHKHLWISIRGSGLARFDGNKLSRFTVKDGLYDDEIFGITGDDRGRLWMACSRGIFAVSTSDLSKFANGELTKFSSTPFSPTDALRTIECKSGVRPAVWKMNDGRIWFSTIRGIIVVDPDRSSRPLPSQNVLIEEVRVNGEEISASQMRHLGPGRNNLQFQYTALSFTAPSRITFRYKLEGFDKDWIEAGLRREAFYTNLTPGDYRFRVQTVNADGSGNEAAESVTFTLAPYFYQTSWFIPLVIVGLVGSSWLAYRLRIRQIKSRLQVVLKERSRIARELHDTLIQGFSGVTMQLQALSARLRETSDRESLSEIINDAGGCLRQARRSVAGLRDTESGESGLVAAIARVARQLTETTDTQLRLRLAPCTTEFHPDVEYNLLQIVREAVVNALKHSGASNLEVTMRSDQRKLTITVSDNGSGFDLKSYLEQSQPGHYGLIGMRERATQIGAEIVWQSEPKKGTSVTISRPLDQPRSSFTAVKELARNAPENVTL